MRCSVSGECEAFKNSLQSTPPSTITSISNATSTTVTGSRRTGKSRWPNGGNLPPKSPNFVDSETSSLSSDTTRLGYTRMRGAPGRDQAEDYERSRNATVRGSAYISRDRDGHTGRAWKGASRSDRFGPNERSGTYNEILERIGD